MRHKQKLGFIPEEAVADIKAKANFDLDRVKEIEAEVRHDIIAFLTNVNEYVGANGRYIHLGTDQLRRDRHGAGIAAQESLWLADDSS